MVAGTRLAVVMGTERRDRPAAPGRPLTVLEDSGDSVGGSTMLSTSVIPARPFKRHNDIHSQGAARDASVALSCCLWRQFICVFLILTRPAKLCLLNPAFVPALPAPLGLAWPQRRLAGLDATFHPPLDCG